MTFDNGISYLLVSRVDRDPFTETAYIEATDLRGDRWTGEIRTVIGSDEWFAMNSLASLVAGGRTRLLKSVRNEDLVPMTDVYSYNIPSNHFTWTEGWDS